jgi:hypothetical protein
MTQSIKGRGWRFSQANNSIGLLGSNRPSTNALQALTSWCAADHRRKYEVTVDDDDHLIATLSTESEDLEAGDDLDRECKRVGVSREPVSE